MGDLSDFVPPQGKGRGRTGRQKTAARGFEPAAEKGRAARGRYLNQLRWAPPVGHMVGDLSGFVPLGLPLGLALEPYLGRA